MNDKGRLARVIGLVMALFFAFGFCTVLVDTIIPKLKATFALSYAEVMLTQFCFFGAYFLVSVPAAWLHSCAFVMTATSSLSAGVVAGVTILAVGLFNSIMFPTIFALAVEGMGERTSQASGIICLAIVGGAVVPLTTGVVADHVGLGLALVVPAACYIWIAFYGLFTARTKGPHDVPSTLQVPVLPA